MEKLEASVRLCGLNSSLPACDAQRAGGKLLRELLLPMGKKALPGLKLFTSDYSILGAD